MAIHDFSGSGGVGSAEFEALLLRLDPLTMDVQTTDGMTIELPDTNREILINMLSENPHMQISVTLPSNESTRIGQRVFVRSQQSIEEFMVTGATTVDNWAASLSPGDNLAYIKIADDTWSRVV